MKILRTLDLLLIWALASLLTSIRGTPVLSGPDMAFLGSRVTFRCVAPTSPPPVTFQLLRDDGLLVGNGTASLRNQSVAFSLTAAASSQGSYRCSVAGAAAGGASGGSSSNSIRLIVVTPPRNTRVTSEPFPPVAWEGSRFSLRCSVSGGSHLSYTWFFNRSEVRTSALLRPLGDQLLMEPVTRQHAGDYSCLAGTTVHDTRRFSSSAPVRLTVKVNVSKPRASLSLTKEGGGYLGTVACASSRGTPPVNFSLSLDGREAAAVTASETLAARFTIPMVPGQHMGEARCRVANEVQELTSEPLPLLVVPVGGGASVEVEYLYRADSQPAAARLSCRLSRGTFPHVAWLFNGEPLPPALHPNGSQSAAHSQYASADRSGTLFVTQLGPEESGLYGCRARDSYDSAGAWVESAPVLVQVTEVPLTTVEILSITFCCFLLLLLVAGSCGIYCMLGRKQARSYVPPYYFRSDTLPLSRPTGHSAHMENYSSPTGFDLHNQTVEVAV